VLTIEPRQVHIHNGDVRLEHVDQVERAQTVGSLAHHADTRLQR
jgi:hypothetical protein